MAIEAEPLSMVRLRNHAPVEAGGFKGCGSVRIGDPLAFGWLTELSKMSELNSPAGGNGRSQILLEIAKKKKRRLRSELFAHEQQRRRRGKQKNCRRRANGTWIRKLGDALAERTVSDLIMILEEGDKRAGRQALGCLTAGFAVSVKGSLALVSESFNQTTAQLVERMFGVVRVVSILLTRDQYVQCMVDIVVPLGCIGSRAAAPFRCYRPMKVT